MCNHYEAATDPSVFLKLFDASSPDLSEVKHHIWPKYQGWFLRAEEEDRKKSDDYSVVQGRWGLVPGQAKNPNLKLSTHNARSETMATAYTFRGAWARGRRCIIAADAIYEPDWRSGKAVSTRISRTDGQLLGIAGLWDEWISPDGEVLPSYTMLTVNADEHQLFKNYHRAEKEKRQVVILPNDRYFDWLQCSPAQAQELLVGFPAEELQAKA